MKKLITGFLSVLSFTLIGVMLSACYGCYTLDGAKDYSGIDCNFFNYSDKATLEHPKRDTAILKNMSIQTVKYLSSVTAYIMYLILMIIIIPRQKKTAWI